MFPILLFLATHVITLFSVEKESKTIFIQPLGYVKPAYIKHIEQSVRNFYGYPCTVKTEQPLTTDLLAASKKRYEASKILAKFKSRENILIITEKDIATINEERKSKEWGIFGLGYRPGSTCVISTFRIRKNASEKLILERLQKIVLHEIGHNLGLNHCTYDSHCLMNAANGTIKQVDKEKIWLCKKCCNQIKRKYSEPV